ncbi:hypothetical protein ACHAWF_000464 [Thalassiosira exigua]
MHTYVHFPSSSVVEAYKDAKSPSPGSSHRCTTYSDACWGSQIGNAVPEGTPIPLFKFRSMSGSIIFRSGGPISWPLLRQERTSLSSCEAEIRATNEASRDTRGVRNLIKGLRDHGYPIDDTSSPTDVYNDNEACVQWSHNMTMKKTCHMENRENTVREWVQDGSVYVRHVAGRCNQADIFTKEMKDAAHFRRLRDSFMSRACAFGRDITTVAANAVSSVLSALHVSASVPGLFCTQDRTFSTFRVPAGRLLWPPSLLQARRV